MTRARALQRKAVPTAEHADRHELYEQSVQDPETDVQLMARLFRRYRRREPISFREDFCGTASLSVNWASSRSGRWAVGIDLDAATLAWAARHRVATAPARVRAAVQLIEADVRDGEGPRTDIACALNFSYSVFKTRGELRRYFETVRDRLVDDGLFFVDAWGGWGAMQPEIERKRLPGFVYEWEVASFDPLTNEVMCHIHFAFPDGSRLDRAFTYDWRLWTVPELREILLEAGFRRVHALWERTDKSGNGTGAWFEPRHVANQELWWTVVVAER
jgi:SAM-dependent methyltransferase